MFKGILIVLSAPSGAGKSTLCDAIHKKIPNLTYSISLTTRPPRSHEKNGKEYYFVNEKEFNERKKELIEYARVHGYWYGTPKNFLEKNLKEGKIVLLDVDVQGGIQIKKLFSEAILIFIAPPSLAVLEQRLRQRRQDNEEIIQRRLTAAQSESEKARHYDYLIVNNQINEAVDQLKCIITAEQLKTQRNQLPVLSHCC